MRNRPSCGNVGRFIAATHGSSFGSGVIMMCGTDNGWSDSRIRVPGGCWDASRRG